MSSAAGVYKGAWMNWDQSGLAGMRLTVSPTIGTVIIAAIALFITACGAQSWSVVRLLLHQLLANGKQGHPVDGDDIDDADIQFTLRNYNAIGAAFHLPKLMTDRLSQRDSRRKFSWLWALLVFAAAIIHVAGWPLAALSASFITGSEDDILVTSPDCGIYVDTSVVSSITPASGFQAKERNFTRVADEYVQTCYNTTESSNSLCRRFVRQQILWSAKPDAPCPFADGMCLQGASSAFEMDTGLLDSHETLGLNSAPENRVLYRRKTICSPVVTKGHGELIPGKLPGEEIAYYYYGVVDGFNATFILSTYAQRSPSGYILV